MKKFFVYFAMAVLTVTMLSGCDKDASDAYTLSGRWTGYIRTYYYDRWGLTGDDYRTTIEFIQRDKYGGWGYEVDYDINDPWGSYYYSPLEWEVNNGVIRINYPDDGCYVEIYRYTLNSDYFRGLMDDGTNRDIEFSLSYVGSVDWGRYKDRGSWRTRTTEESDSTDVIVNGESVATGAFARAIKTQQLQ